MTTERITRLADLLRANRGATVLTGAGISTESGIPDFRSPETGLYSRMDPMEYLSAPVLESDPAKFWKCFAELYGKSPDYRPNAGHVSIARLEKSGHVGTVVTQNIDGLHQKAGSVNVLEVHGHLRTVHCTGCGRVFALTLAADQVTGGAPVPECSDCGLLLRPDVVLFGDAMPADFAAACEAARSASLLLVVGSSLTVSPVNCLAFEARRLAIVNREPTPADDRADAVVRGEAGETLSALCAELGAA
jgi:NAD-dependent deacetylase